MLQHALVAFYFYFQITHASAKKKNSHKEFLQLEFGTTKLKRGSGGSSAKTMSVDSPDMNYACLPPVTDDRWLQSVTGVTGLCNQLFAVFSAVPVALVFNSSLLLGPMFSRRTFGLTHREFHFGKGNHRELPFSTFFDFEYFRDYWRDKRGLVVSDSNWSEGNMSQCRNLKNYGYKPLVIYRPRWRPYADYEFTDIMLNVSRIPHPIQPRAVVSVKSVMGMMAMYDFFQSNKRGEAAPLPDKLKILSMTKEQLYKEYPRLPLLIDVYRSINPSKRIQRTVDKIVKKLPTVFWVAHLRIEADTVFLPPSAGKKSPKQKQKPKPKPKSKSDGDQSSSRDDEKGGRIKGGGRKRRGEPQDEGGGGVEIEASGTLTGNKGRRNKGKKKGKRSAGHRGGKATAITEKGAAAAVERRRSRRSSRRRILLSTSSSSATVHISQQQQQQQQQQPTVVTQLPYDTYFQAGFQDIVQTIEKSSCISQYLGLASVPPANDKDHTRNTSSAKGTDSTGGTNSNTGSSNSSSSSTATAPQLLQQMIFNHAHTHPLPAIYLASGVFRSSSPLLRERGKTMIRYLRSLGFTQIFTQPLLGRDLDQRIEGGGGVEDGVHTDTQTNIHGTANTPHAASGDDEDYDRFFMDEVTAFDDGRATPPPLSPGSGSSSSEKKNDGATSNNSNHSPRKSRPIDEVETDVATLDPEQNAYVDLLIARRAACFVPAHKSSSFSYMALRLNELEKGQFATEIEHPHNTHMSWGF